MKYILVMGIILSQLALHGVADKKYADDIARMNIEHGVLVYKDEAHLMRPVKVVCSNSINLEHIEVCYHV